MNLGGSSGVLYRSRKWKFLYYEVRDAETLQLLFFPHPLSEGESNHFKKRFDPDPELFRV